MKSQLAGEQGVYKQQKRSLLNRQLDLCPTLAFQDELYMQINQ